jgi:hypothetical protein
MTPTSRPGQQDRMRQSVIAPIRAVAAAVALAAGT